VDAKAQRCTTPGSDYVAGIAVPGACCKDANVKEGREPSCCQCRGPLRALLQVASEVARKGRNVRLIGGLCALQWHALRQQRLQRGCQQGATLCGPAPIGSGEDGCERAIKGPQRSCDLCCCARAQGHVDEGAQNAGAWPAPIGSGPEAPQALARSQPAPIHDQVPHQPYIGGPWHPCRGASRGLQKQHIGIENA
jgi:hypothetical protein